jgi:hypothetical protein
MKNFIYLIFVFSILLSSCSAFPTPAPTPNIELTIESAADEIVSLTLTAMPTYTIVPTQTSTPVPTSTETLSPEVTATGNPALLTTATPWVGTLSPGNTDGLPEGLLRIENQTGIPGVVVSLYGVTLKREQPIYYAWNVDRSLNSNILWAAYNYTVIVPGKSTFQGSFTQNNYDKTTFVVSLKGVKITGP